MKVVQTAELGAPRERVWEALLDFELLRRVLPGVEELTPVSADACTLVVRPPVPSLTGVYRGTVGVVASTPPDGYRLAGDARGRLGWVKGETDFALAAAGEAATALTMAMSVQVGGALAGAGQRFMEAAVRSMAREFLRGLERELTPETSVAQRVE